MSTLQTETTHSEVLPVPEMRRPMRFRLAALIFMMVQGVSFGTLTVAVLASPLKQWAEILLPIVVVVSFVASVYFSWRLAPSMRARFERKSHEGERHPADAATN